MADSNSKAHQTMHMESAQMMSKETTDYKQQTTDDKQLPQLSISEWDKNLITTDGNNDIDCGASL